MTHLTCKAFCEISDRAGPAEGQNALDLEDRQRGIIESWGRGTLKMAEIEDIQLLDVVQLNVNLPVEDLVAGAKGTVVEVFSSDNFLVEFADEQGHTLAMTVLQREQLRVIWRMADQQGVA